MQVKKGLGRGISSLIPSAEVVLGEKVGAEEKGGIIMVDVDAIVPNRSQPRRSFSDDALKELADSIRQNGVLQPLLVAPPVSGRYELIAGERRLRAARLAGVSKVPVVVREVEGDEMLELALIENLQREDLNPMEEAVAYKEMMDTFGYTQEEIAGRVSKSRSYVANAIRLLSLPTLLQEDVATGRLTPGHARLLLAIQDLEMQLKIRERILHSGMTVKDLEMYIQRVTNKNRRRKKYAELSPQTKAVEDEMARALGMKVRIKERGNKGGYVVIEYYTSEDLNNIYRRIISTN